ncbi:hotdog fold thioesterase [Deinococcus aluminii]|uniref:Proofreading thioesterase EntH n=1 Tax=Deinococcus aluminii TaxID=1656885 RepID=A0ABP9XFJ8_9DEIO
MTGEAAVKESIWFAPFTPEDVNDHHANTLAERLGIVATEVGPDYIVAQMPIDARTVQPYRMMHGGASAALAETLGSVGAMRTLNPQTHRCVGTELNISHLRPIAEGGVATGRAEPVHLGCRTQVWAIHVYDERGKQTSEARLTVFVLEQDARP